MSRRYLLSQAMSGGRKQLLGQAPLLALTIMFAAAVVLVLAGRAGRSWITRSIMLPRMQNQPWIYSRLNLPTMLTLHSGSAVRIASLWKLPSILDGSHGSGEVDSNAWRHAIISFCRSTCSRRASNYEGKRLEQWSFISKRQRHLGYHRLYLH